MEDGRVREVMTILGGYGPNCSDYCRDFWHYDFRDGRWVVQYLEYWSKFGEWAATVNYSKSLEKLPDKRWRHSAMTHGNRLYLCATVPFLHYVIVTFEQVRRPRRGVQQQP